jgi:hypothetical protein
MLRPLWLSYLTRLTRILLSLYALIMGNRGILWDDSRVRAKWQGQRGGIIYHFSFDIQVAPAPQRALPIMAQYIARSI